MKKILVIVTFFLASLHIFAADGPCIHIENQSDSKLNIPYLSQGNIQYYLGHFDEKTFEQLPNDLASIDEVGVHKEKGVHLLLYRYAYVLPVKHNFIFDNNLYADPKFILAINGNVSAVDIPDPKNALHQIHTFHEIRGASRAVYHILHSEVQSKEGRIMKAQTLNPNDDLLLTATTISQYYPHDDFTLVVCHKFAALKPSFKLKFAFGTGLGQLFLREEEKVLVKSVIETRKYLKTLALK